MAEKIAEAFLPLLRPEFSARGESFLSSIFYGTGRCLEEHMVPGKGVFTFRVGDSPAACRHWSDVLRTTDRTGRAAVSGEESSR